MNKLRLNLKALFDCYFCLVISPTFFSSCYSQDALNNIVVVNLGGLEDEVIARQIEIIHSFNPRVIAIDRNFNASNESLRDSILITALNKCKNLVMPISITDYTSDDINYSEWTGSLPEFLTGAKIGFVNVILEDDDLKTLKKFSVSERVNGKIVYQFAVQAAMRFDSLKTMNFVYSNHRIIDVHYQKDQNAFHTFGVNEILEGNVSSTEIEGKIILLGSFSARDADIFYSPLNSKAKP